MVKQLAWISTLSLSMLVTACAADVDGLPVASDETAILGGQTTQLGQFPTVVALVMEAKSPPGAVALCSGTLIAPKVVLTAAHCLETAELGWSTKAEAIAHTTVLIDSRDAYALDGRKIKVTDTIPHPQFTEPGNPDLGIVKLATAITDRKPSPLNFDPAKAPIGTRPTMVGYGISQVGNQFSAGKEYVLQSEASIACSSINPQYGVVPDSMFLCFGQADGTGKCSGDSGGPSFALIDGVQKVVGVTSFGDMNCGDLGVDMRVDAGRAFIIANAPEAFCQPDGTCDQNCGSDGLPKDPDCSPCTQTSDCPANSVCTGNVCVPMTPPTGSLGSPCASGAECDSGICGTGPDGSMKCTEVCDPAASSCADGFDCLGTGNQGQGACWPSNGPEDPGNDKPGPCACHVGGAQSGSGAAGGGLATLLLVGALLGRRRRRA